MRDEDWDGGSNGDSFDDDDGGSDNDGGGSNDVDDCDGSNESGCIRLISEVS